MEKQLIKIGKSTYLLISSVMKEITGIEDDDFISIKCSKNKIVITKVEKNNNK